MTKIDYGLDAPGLIRTFFIASVLVVVAAFVVPHALFERSTFSSVVTVVISMVAAYLFGMGCLMVYWSKFAKVVGRERVLDLVSWRGDEHVLDVGCGRGLMLIGAAKRLKVGRVVGVDIWEAKDQSSNSSKAVLENVQLAGVAGNVEVLTADARTLPFPNGSFDVVVSHWMVHNLPDTEDRRRVLSEMVRVLRGNTGRLIVCDIEHRDEYVAVIKSLGLVDVRMIYGRLSDLILGVLSFGSFRPTTIIANAAK